MGSDRIPIKIHSLGYFAWENHGSQVGAMVRYSILVWNTCRYHTGKWGVTKQRVFGIYFVVFPLWFLLGMFNAYLGRKGVYLQFIKAGYIMWRKWAYMGISSPVFAWYTQSSIYSEHIHIHIYIYTWHKYVYGTYVRSLNGTDHRPVRYLMFPRDQILHFLKGNWSSPTSYPSGYPLG